MPGSEWDEREPRQVSEFDPPRGPAGFMLERRMNARHKLLCFYQTGTEDPTAPPNPATMKGLPNPDC